MKKLKIVILLGIMILGVILLTGCTEGTDTQKDIEKTLEIGDKLANNQSTPTDIDYSIQEK